MKVRLVLLIDDALENIALDLSAKINESFDTYFTLDDKHIPHITITTITFDDEDLEDVLDVAKGLVSGIETKEIELSEIVHDWLGYISIHFKDSEWIEELHLKANEVFGKKYAVKTEPFFAHLTLTRLKNEEDAQKVLNSIDFPEGKFDINALAVCESGENGTCTRIIKKYKL